MFKFLRELCLLGLNIVLMLLLLITLKIYDGYGAPGIQPNLDVAQFQDSNHQSYIEMYYSISEEAIKYIADKTGKYSCQILMDMQIYQNENIWASKAWKIEQSIEDTAQIKEQSQLVDIIRYYIEAPAKYKIMIHVNDLNQPDQLDSNSTEIECHEYSQDKLEISDIELALNIKRAVPGSQSVFLKNIYEVMPNPGGLYGEGAPILYYYFEAYNLLNNIKGSKYKSLCQIQDYYGRIYEEIGSSYRTKKKIIDYSIELGMMNIAILPSGKYKLVYGIADSSESVHLSKEKQFFVFNPSVSSAEFTKVKEKAMMVEGNYGPLEILNEKDLDEEFKHMLYIITKDNNEFYKSLTIADAKRKFIFSIWKSPAIFDPQHMGLAFREIYLDRVRKADASFKSIFNPGWKSDRGRVFILYGSPYNVERYPSTQTTFPYEIWTYDNLRGQGGVIFVFSDRAGFSKYELIHSTLRGELQERNWRQLIATGSTSTYR